MTIRTKIFDNLPESAQKFIALLYRKIPRGLRYVLSYPLRIPFVAPSKHYSIFDAKMKKYEYNPYVCVEEDDVVVDVGAHTGRFTLPAASKGKLVVSAEPDPVNCEILRWNVGHLRNVIIGEKLIWKRNEEKYMKLGADLTDSSSINVDKTSLGRKLKVNGITLDKLASDLGINKIDFLKVDAEGAEPEVLKGGKEILKKTGKVSIDAGPERFGESTSELCRKILRSKGFRTYVTEDEMVYAWR